MIVKKAVEGIKRIFRSGYRYKKAGVILYELHEASSVRGLLDYDREKSKEVQNIEFSSGSAKEASSSQLNRERKRKEAEERNQRYKNLKPLQTRLAKVESRLEVLMQAHETLQTQLADASIYEADQKIRLMETLDQQNTLKTEEKILMEEWDELTVAVEQFENL